MEVFTGELTSEGVRPPLGRALVPEEDYGSALYIQTFFFFSYYKEISFQSLNFIMYSNHKNDSSGHVHSLLHSRVIIYSLGDSRDQVKVDRLTECKWVSS